MRNLRKLTFFYNGLIGTDCKMGTQGQTGLVAQKKMHPPQSGRFEDREDLIKYVRDFGADQGYVVTIKKSRKDRRVILGCDRGGVYRNRRKIAESPRKRKASSRLINCPFEAIGKKEDDAWMLTIKNGSHNHEPLKDRSEHPYSRRFTEDEVKQIKLMTEAGIKPRQVLKALKQHNPDLQSTPRHLYNLKAKIRQGNLSDKNFKSWRPNISVPTNSSHTVAGDSIKQNHQLKVPNLIGGEFLDSHNCQVVDVINPATQEVVSHVPLTTYEEFKAAVNAAKQAFPSWRNTPIYTRQCVMFKFQELILRDMDKLVMNIVAEQGKTLKDAQDDIICGLEVVKHACRLATMQMGEFIPSASDGIDSYCIREPIGVCAGICSLNHPATVSLWMFPIAVTCGNTFVLKPCETHPGASMLLASLAMESGLPDGVLNIVHGSHDIISYICDDEDIKAVSFSSSSSVGKHIYARAAATAKKVQSHFGGKSHAIIMPDANMEATLSALVDAGLGTVGRTCMAIDIIVSVGSSTLWEEKLVECAKALKVNVGTDPNADLGPVTTKEVKNRFCKLIQSGIEDGARLLLDGRDIVVSGYENGNFIGPTILSGVTTDMACYKEEFFGPVLLFMQADNLEEAITIVNRNKNRNGASIFTTSGIYARKFQSEVEVGTVGINVAVTVPLPSSFNDKVGLEFYTQLKRVAQQWKNSPSIGVSMAVPSPSERHLRSRAAPSMLVSTSEKDSPGMKHRSLPPLPSTSDRDSPSVPVLLPNPRITPTGLTNERSTSSPPTPDRNLHGLSLISTLSSEGDVSNQDLSPAMLSQRDRDLPGQAMSMATSRSSDRLYIPQKSHWNETPRADSIPSSSERIHASFSQTSSIKGQACRTTHPALVLATERGLYVPTSHDAICLINHGNDSTSPSRRMNTMCQSSERVYMLATSHLNDSMGQTLERTDTSLFPSSERHYAPPSSDGNDHISLASHTDVTLQSTSDRMFLSSLSERDDNMASTASQQGESLTSTSERMYRPPLVHRNAGMAPKSEWLCITTPAGTQRMYTQDPMVSADEFQCQGASLTLPASQRM